MREEGPSVTRHRSCFLSYIPRPEPSAEACGVGLRSVRSRVCGPETLLSQFCWMVYFAH